MKLFHPTAGKFVYISCINVAKVYSAHYALASSASNSKALIFSNITGLHNKILFALSLYTHATEICNRQSLKISISPSTTRYVDCRYKL